MSIGRATDSDSIAADYINLLSGALTARNGVERRKSFLKVFGGNKKNSTFAVG